MDCIFWDNFSMCYVTQDELDELAPPERYVKTYCNDSEYPIFRETWETEDGRRIQVAYTMDEWNNHHEQFIRQDIAERNDVKLMRLIRLTVPKEHYEKCLRSMDLKVTYNLKKSNQEVKKASDADRILKILESAKDKNGDVPMSIVRKAFDKLLPSAQPDVPDINVGDMISRRAAIDIINVYAERFNGYIGTPNDSEVYAYARGLLLSIERNIRTLPSAQPEYEPVTAEDFAKTMSEHTVYRYMAWHGEALALMKEQGFVICKKAM